MNAFIAALYMNRNQNLVYFHVFCLHNGIAVLKGLSPAHFHIACESCAHLFCRAKGEGSSAADKEPPLAMRSAMRRCRLRVQPEPVQSDPGVILKINLRNIMSHRIFDIELCK